MTTLPDTSENMAEFIQTVYLTPSQSGVLSTLKQLFKDFNVVLLWGATGCGKNTVASAFFHLEHIQPTIFDVCAFTLTLDHRFTVQDVIKHLDQLLPEVGSTSVEPAYIYIRHFDRILELLNDRDMDNNKLTYLAIIRWFDSLGSTRVLLTSRHNSIHYECTNFWSTKLSLKIGDYRAIMANYGQSNNMNILTERKQWNLDDLIRCLKYARCMDGYLEPSTKLVHERPGLNSFCLHFTNALRQISDGGIVAHDSVSKPLPINLIGLDSALELIEINVINPIHINCPDVPVKRGIIISGPPGTGKTSVGRWLAHKLEGRFYLLTGTGISGSEFISSITKTIAAAQRTGPAVVFMDDIDCLFTSSDTYRSFLTILDGLDGRSRRNVCVIATCMDIGKIPGPLLRGGRLELHIRMNMPTSKQIRVVVKSHLAHITDIVNQQRPEYSHLVQYNNATIKQLATRTCTLNYADIQCAFDDSLRYYLYGTPTIPIDRYLAKIIERILEQYRMCANGTIMNEPAQLPYYG